MNDNTKFKEFKKAVKEAKKTKSIIIVADLGVIGDTPEELDKNLKLLAENEVILCVAGQYDIKVSLDRLQ